MGTLSCLRCFAQAEASTQAEADDLIDHARGQKIGRPCGGNQNDLRWSETTTTASEPATTKSGTEATLATLSPTKKNKPKSKKG